MFKVEIELRNKQKISLKAQSYVVGSSVLVLDYGNKSFDYYNLRDVFKVSAIEIEK